MTNKTQNKEIEIGIKIANNELTEKERLKIQLEIVTGNMLGDGCLVSDAIKNLPKAYSMQLTSKDRHYIDHLSNVYKPWTTAKIYDKKKVKKNKQEKMQLQIGALLQEFKKYYFHMAIGVILLISQQKKYYHLIVKS